MTTHYTVSLLRSESHYGNQEAIEHLRNSVFPSLDAAGVTVYGLFAPLFGLSTNELYLVTNEVAADRAELLAPQRLQAVESHHFVPTVRPLDHGPRDTAGVYVFRWFEVRTGDVDRITRLSADAWTTFEAGFDTRVQGLFRQQTDEPVSTMLLLTWYRNLAAWEASRSPARAARENFAARAQLALSARPIATRLVTLQQKTSKVGHDR